MQNMMSNEKRGFCQDSIQAQLPAHSVYVYGWQRDVYSADCSAIHAVFLIKPCHMEEKVWGVLERGDQRSPPDDTTVLTLNLQMGKYID